MRKGPHVRMGTDRVAAFGCLGFLAMTVLAGVGCTQLTPQARQSLIDADRLYKTGQFAAAQQSLDGWLAENEAVPEVAEAYYLRGLCRLKLENRSAGQADLQLARQKARRPDLKSHAAATLGCMAFEDGQFDRAAALLSQAAQALPAKPPLDVVLFRLGTAQQRIGQWAASREAFSRLATAVPRSPLILPARRKLNWPHDHFSIQCGAFRTSDSAGKAVSDLRAKGFDASPNADRSDGGLHRVYVGRYATWADATGALTRVQAAGQQAVIVP